MHDLPPRETDLLENLSCDLIPRGATLRGVSSLCIYMYTLHEINTTVILPGLVFVIL
jgi:hypothetical protein